MAENPDFYKFVADPDNINEVGCFLGYKKGKEFSNSDYYNTFTRIKNLKADQIYADETFDIIDKWYNYSTKTRDMKARFNQGIKFGNAIFEKIKSKDPDLVAKIESKLGGEKLTDYKIAREVRINTPGNAGAKDGYMVADIMLVKGEEIILIEVKLSNFAEYSVGQKKVINSILNSPNKQGKIVINNTSSRPSLLMKENDIYTVKKILRIEGPGTPKVEEIINTIK